jgi:hypothetical protein
MSGYTTVKIFAYTAILSSLLCSSPVKAFEGTTADYSSFKDYFDQTRFHGRIRNYLQSTAKETATPRNKSFFMLGGYAGLVSAPFYNFQIGATLGVLTQPVPEDPFATLLEGYLQYKNKYFLARGPNQIIDAPFIMPSDSAQLPTTYRAAYTETSPFADYKPLKDLKLIALHVFDYKWRWDHTYMPDNNYVPGHTRALSVSQLAGVTTNGTTAVALKYNKKNAPFTAQLWWNKFWDFSQLLWFDSSYTHTTGTGYDPVFGLQFGQQWSDGNNWLTKSGQGGAANSQVYGVLVGLNTPYVNLSAAWNGIPTRKGTFGNGALVSPYSVGAGTDPLYTTDFIEGFVEKQSGGNAYIVQAVSYFLEKKVRVLVSYDQFFLNPTVGATSGDYKNTSKEYNVDLTYTFSKDSRLKGFSLRNRFGLMTGYKPTGEFIFNWLQLNYQF